MPDVNQDSASGAAADFARLLGPVALELLNEPQEKRRGGQEWRYGTNGSLKVEIDRGIWYDHEANDGGNTLDLLRVRGGMEKPAALNWLRERKLIEDRPKPGAKQSSKLVAAYDYRDEAGALLFQVCRFGPEKTFRQRKPTEAGKWDWTTKGVRLVPFRLPELIEAIRQGQTIYIAEGEKGANCLASIGLAATCSPRGAGKWRKEFSPLFAGAAVVILPDNDDAGRKHAEQVTAHLLPVARSIRVLALPGLPPKSDVFDWIEAGGTAAQLEDLAAKAPNAEQSRVKQALADEVLLTEHGVALEFTKRHQDQLRFCHSTGAWFLWTGTHWRQDRKAAAFSFARQLVAEANREAEFKTQAITGKAAFAGGVERFARSDQNLAVTADDWNPDPWLLGTPGGTVDLRTGALRPALPFDMITRTTAITPAEDGNPPVWRAFLHQATAGDVELIGFLKRWCGYCLTGLTREHALLFIYGPGGNGKSVFLNTIASILGEYHATAAMDTFTDSGGGRHFAFLAMLAGARMVTSAETEEGQPWAQTRINEMTGGSAVTANFMRQNPFTFTPQFKITITGNHKPVLRNVDDAARRRFNIVPFLHKPAEPDRKLEDKLREEWPAILRWMIDGCLSWGTDGLPKPAVVKAATDEYFAAQDTFGQWVAERCIIDPSLNERPGKLLADLNAWLAANGDQATNRTRFRGWAEKQSGLKYKAIKGRDYLGGIGLRAPEGVQGGQG